MHYSRSSLWFQIWFFLGLFIAGVIFLMPQGVLALEAASTQKVLVNGTIEVEAQTYRRKFDDPNNPTVKESDIALAEVEIEIDAEINPSVQGHVLLLWEEGETDDINDFLDEGTVTISNPDKCPYYISAGKMYLPFGSFETNFITDPMTLELGEINDTAVQIGYQKGNTDISFGSFNGDIDKIGDDNKINSFFANATVTYSQEPYNMGFGVSYLSNLADTDTLEEAINVNGVNEYVQGLGAFLKADMGAWYLSAEYLAAIESFDPVDFSPNVLISNTIRPETYNVEFGWQTKGKAFLTLKYENADDMEYFDLPENRYGICLSYILYDEVSLSFEYLHEKYDNVNLNKGKNDVITAQLAISF